MDARRSPELLRLADAVLAPGFVGTTPPDWVRRRLAGGLGGVVLYGRNIENAAQVAALTAALRAERPDVIVATDEEAGDVTRLETAVGSSRPGNLALGVVDDPDVTEEVARDLGRELAAAGITLNYAPTVDVNSNPENPVVGARSFGADPSLVSRHSAAWVRGLQATGVAACAKHFPGHGATEADSHESLPVVLAPAEELEKISLPPFRAAIEAGVRAVMTGHLLVPAYDPARPATLSSRILTDLLRTGLGFTGVVVTDGIEMASVTKHLGIAAAAVRALAAGADTICVGGEFAGEGVAVLLRDSIADAVEAGLLAEERLAEAAGRVGALAAWTAAHRAAPEPAASNGLGVAVARRALRLTATVGAPALPLTVPPHVVELAAHTNMAVDPRTPWGLAAPLAALLPGTTSVRIGADSADGLPGALEGGRGRPVVLVVRDAHRLPWVSAALGRLLDTRPDAIVVEMGVPGPERPGAVHLATHGASRACALAAADLLAGGPAG